MKGPGGDEDGALDGRGAGRTRRSGEDVRRALGVGFDPRLPALGDGGQDFEAEDEDVDDRRHEAGRLGEGAQLMIDGGMAVVGGLLIVPLMLAALVAPLVVLLDGEMKRNGEEPDQNQEGPRARHLPLLNPEAFRIVKESRVPEHGERSTMGPFGKFMSVRPERPSPLM